MATLLFFTHAPQLRWQAEVARALTARHTHRCVLWTTGPQNHAVGIAGGAFDRVVDVLDGFDPIAAPSDPAAPDLATIAEFESRTGGPCFHRFASVDRQLIRRRWPAGVVARYGAHLAARLTEEYATFDEEPAAVLGENNFLPYRMARRLVPDAVPYWAFTLPRHLSGRFFLDESQSARWLRFRDLYREYRDLGVPPHRRQWAEARLDTLVEAHEQPSYMNRSERGLPGLSALTPRRLRRYAGQVRNERRAPASPVDLAARSRRELAEELPMAAVRSVRRRRFDRLATRTVPSGRLAAFYPHVPGEHSIDVQGFDQRDQARLVETIATALPADVTLAVKEHDPAVGRRRVDFYARVAALPNAVLLDDRIDSYDLTRRCEFVVTVTGTAGLEAVMLGTPAIVTGDPFFSAVDGVEPASSPVQLRAAIAAGCSGELTRPTRTDAVACLAAMHDASHVGTVSFLAPAAVLEDDNIEEIAAGVQRELEIVGRLRPPRSVDDDVVNHGGVERSST